MTRDDQGANVVNAQKLSSLTWAIPRLEAQDALRREFRAPMGSSLLPSSRYVSYVSYPSAMPAMP